MLCKCWVLEHGGAGHTPTCTFCSDACPWHCVGAVRVPGTQNRGGAAHPALRLPGGQPGARGGDAGEETLGWIGSTPTTSSFWSSVSSQAHVAVMRLSTRTLGSAVDRQRSNRQQLRCRCPDAASHMWRPLGQQAWLLCYSDEDHRCEALHVSAGFCWPTEHLRPCSRQRFLFGASSCLQAAKPGMWEFQAEALCE